MSIEDVIRASMAELRPVALHYDRNGGLPRIVHPHVLYRSATGKTCVDAYQVEGPSTSAGALPTWRSLDIAKIGDAVLLEGRFEIAPGLDPMSRRYRDAVIAHV